MTTSDRCAPLPPPRLFPPDPGIPSPPPPRSSSHAACSRPPLRLALAAAVRVPLRALPQAVLRLVGGGLGPLSAPGRRHHQLSPQRAALDLALLAPGGHRVDRPRAALCRAGLLPAGSAGGPGISRWCSSRRSGRTSPSTGSITSSGPPGRRSSSSAWRPCGPGWVFLPLPATRRSSGATLLASRLRPLGPSPPGLPRSSARAAPGSPWGYYIDILLALAVGAGILLLVLDDLRRGLSALSASLGRSAAGGTASRTCWPRCSRAR